jgi:hypothetical protein
LPDLAREISARSGRGHITLDSYIVSATLYEDLRKKYDDGTWDIEKFAHAHILFMEPGNEHDYIGRIITEQLTSRST